MIESFKNLWVEKWRPTQLEDLILSSDNRKYFENIKKTQEIPHLLLCGVQGSGKSSLAKIIVNELLNCQYIYINASDENGIDTIRNKISNFVQTKAIDGKLKVVILDESCGLSSSAQQALRNLIEEYSNNNRFILTANYSNKLIDPIQSRMQKFELIPPIDGCIKRCIDIIKEEGIKVENGQKERLSNLIKTNYPDLRAMINELQKYSINNILNIPKNLHIASSFANDIFDKLIAKEDIIKIRKFIIESEVLFNNDFHLLLKELFEIIYEYNLSAVSLEQKKNIMLIVSEAMYKHQNVLDKEINCFATLIEISDILK
jgi:replication factor C small subunit